MFLDHAREGVKRGSLELSLVELEKSLIQQVEYFVKDCTVLEVVQKRDRKVR